MPAFSQMARWPVGYFRAFSQWLLTNRWSVGPRLAMINAEISKIGFITVRCRGEAAADGSITMTEERVGFDVDANTTLARLVQAYIANGGNPFDISPFWIPDRTEITGKDGDGKPIRVEQYPYGGVLAAQSAEPNEPLPETATDDKGKKVIVRSGFGGNVAGLPKSDKNHAIRLGTRTPIADHSIVSAMRKMRDWANQDIKERLNDIEWRIIKQMDLREQLEQERDILLTQAFGGALDGLKALSPRRFNPSLTVQSLVQDMYEIIYEMDEATKTVKAFRAGPDVDFLDFTYANVPSEDNRDPLG